MAWWPTSDPRYPKWRNQSTWIDQQRRAIDDAIDVVHACECVDCECNEEDLYALIRFEALRPVEVVSLAVGGFDGHYL